MFGPTFKSTSGKMAGAVLALIGMVGGWTLTAELGGFQLASTGSVSAAVPGYHPGVALDFPRAVLAAQSSPQSGPTETKVENVGSLEVSYEVPVAAAPPALPPAPQCVEELTSTVAALTSSVAGIVTAEHAAGALTQVNALGEAANACAQQVSALGSAGMDQLAQVGQQLNGLVGTIGALPLLPPTPAPPATDEPASPMDKPIETTLEMVGKGLDVTLDVVNGVTGETGGLLGGLLNLGRER
ncbi:MAG: hypothetical protein WD602_02430 [Actinomycetota bacterium]